MGSVLNKSDKFKLLDAESDITDANKNSPHNICTTSPVSSVFLVSSSVPVQLWLLFIRVRVQFELTEVKFTTCWILCLLPDQKQTKKQNGRERLMNIE